MSLSEEFIKANNLSEEQVTSLNNEIGAIETKYSDAANKNAEGILQGAAQYAQKITGVQLEREDKEKFGVYLNRLGDAFVSAKSEGVKQLEDQLKGKVQNFEGNEALKLENEQLKESIGTFKQKAAQFDEWSENDYKGKFEQASNNLVSLKQSLAFQSSKPIFPDSVNEYEAAAKWDEFKSGVLEKYDIHIGEDNKAMLKDKENEFKTVSLNDLVKSSKSISELLKGNVSPGLQTGPASQTVEGVPFKVKKEMSSIERSKAIKEYLTNDLKLSTTSGEYSKKFAEYNSVLMGKTPSK
jgi:regulator of replication initiation timing